MNFNAHNHLRTESSAKSPKEAIRKAKLLSQIELYRELMAEGFKMHISMHGDHPITFKSIIQ